MVGILCPVPNTSSERGLSVARLGNDLLFSVGSPSGCQADIKVCPINPGDRLLLCSDGLTDMVDEERILTTAAVRDISEATESLVSMALAGGGKDNVTLTLVTIP